MTRTILKDVVSSLVVALVLAGAIAVVWFAMLTQARADGGGYYPPPPPLLGPYMGPRPWGIPTGPMIQEPPRQSCVETAIQLAYQTGNPRVGQAAAAACQWYAPIRPAYMYYGGPPVPLGGYPNGGR